eukprot:361354-Chlamydomonas_euryale.AAC.5
MPYGAAAAPSSAIATGTLPQGIGAANAYLSGCQSEGALMGGVGGGATARSASCAAHSMHLANRDRTNGPSRAQNAMQFFLAADSRLRAVIHAGPGLFGSR